MKSSDHLAVYVPQPRSGAAVLVIPGQSLERRELQAAYDRYRLVSGGTAPDLLASTDMLEARVALILALVADGWKAPATVLERLRLDEEILAPKALLVAS